MPQKKKNAQKIPPVIVQFLQLLSSYLAILSGMLPLDNSASNLKLAGGDWTIAGETGQ